MQGRLKNGFDSTLDLAQTGALNGLSWVSEKAFNVAVAAADPQLANYKAVAALTVLNGLALYYRSYPTISNTVVFADLLLGVGLFLREYGPQNTLISCVTPVRSAFRAAVSNGTALFHSIVPTVEEKPAEVKQKKLE